MKTGTSTLFLLALIPAMTPLAAGLAVAAVGLDLVSPGTLAPAAWVREQLEALQGNEAAAVFVAAVLAALGAGALLALWQIGRESYVEAGGGEGSYSLALSAVERAAVYAGGHAEGVRRLRLALVQAQRDGLDITGEATVVSTAPARWLEPHIEARIREAVRDSLGLPIGRIRIHAQEKRPHGRISP